MVVVLLQLLRHSDNHGNSLKKDIHLIIIRKKNNQNKKIDLLTDTAAKSN